MKARILPNGTYGGIYSSEFLEKFRDVVVNNQVVRDWNLTDAIPDDSLTFPIWNGAVWIEGKDTQIAIEEQNKILESKVPFSISRLQGRLQLHKLGMLEAVQAIVNQSPIEVQLYWNEAATWERQSPILNQMAPAIGMSQQQLDQFFIDAEKLY